MQPIDANADGWFRVSKGDISLDELPEVLSFLQEYEGVNFKINESVLKLARMTLFWIHEAGDPLRRSALETYQIIPGLDKLGSYEKTYKYYSFAVDSLETLSAFLGDGLFRKFTADDIADIYEASSPAKPTPRKNVVNLIHIVLYLCKETA